MAKAAEKGYSVTSKQKSYYQETGQLQVAMLLAGYPGGIGYMAMRGRDAFETGDRYKVSSNFKYGSGSSPYQRSNQQSNSTSSSAYGSGSYPYQRKRNK